VNCRDVIRDLSGYLDGELNKEVIGDLERHVSRCTDCRLVVDTVRKTIEIYCNAEAIPLPDDVRARLHQALEKRLSRRPAV
jgi:anti-sigma factor RsiW